MSTAPNPSTALGRVVVDELWRNGVRHVVVSPGSRSAALAMAAEDHPGMQVWVDIDERSAGFFALGLSRGSGRTAAVVTTSGTAVANLFPAVVEADAAGVPLLVLSADRPPELRHAGANQTIDQVKAFGGAVRWFCELGTPEDLPGSNAYWRSVVCRAVADASGFDGPSGPVHLNMSFREPLVPASDDGRTTAPPFSSPLDGRPDGAPWTRVEAPPPGRRAPMARLDGDARRPVVVIGAVPDAAGIAEQALDRLIPVIAEGHSGARIPGTVSTGHHLLGHAGFLESHRPDLVVTVGRVGLSRNLDRLLGAAGRHVAVAEHGWPDPGRSAAELRRLPILLGLDPGEGWSETWARADGLVRRIVDGILDRIEVPTEPRTARDVALAVDEGAVLAVGSSMPVRDLDWFMAPRRVEVLSNRGASGIDGFVSTVLGASAGRGRPVVALLGDLALLHDANGFLVDRRPDAVLVVVDNDGGGIFSFLPQARFPRHFERLFGTPHGRDVEKLAAFHGLDYARVEKATDLVDTVASRVEAGGIGLVHVRTDRDENVDVHRGVAAAVARALDEMVGRLSPGREASPGA